MLRINQLKLLVGHSKEELVIKVKKILRCEQTPEITIVRRSVDARKKPVLYFNYILDVKVKNQAEVYRRCDKKQVVICEKQDYMFPVSTYQGQVRPVVIGTGPAGLFCGLMLARAGFRPILLERGKPVAERMKDVRRFWQRGALDEESNVQFGEGGAGTFSDGKLNTLVKDKYGRNREVLRIFTQAGAPEEILYDHKPHIGTDVLCRVIEKIRHEIENAGGSIRFQAKVTDFLIRDEEIKGVIINGEEIIEASYVVLAPGHSARDTFQVLDQHHVRLEAKPFAVGLRVEHPQELINQSQYGKKDDSALGSAAYKVTANVLSGRGVYSFCMCPGGYVVNASSEQGRLSVNGMSYSGRKGKNANSAIIVSVTPEDYGGNGGPLAGVEFQRRLEKKAFDLAQGKVPVEKFKDYKEAVMDKQPETGNFNATPKIADDFTPCIKGLWTFAPVHKILPEELSKAFVEGMEQFGKVIDGFSDGNALVEGIESRTSSPVRIIRDESFQSSVRGLYPCGEGAGYAGGITSAAMDGIRVAEAVAEHIVKSKG